MNTNDYTFKLKIESYKDTKNKTHVRWALYNKTTGNLITNFRHASGAYEWLHELMLHNQNYYNTENNSILNILKTAE